MDNREEKAIISFWMRYPRFTMTLIYNVVTLSVIVVFYPLVPLLLGYPPNFINVTKAVGASYNIQFVAVALICVLVGTSFSLMVFKDIGKWWSLESGNIEDIKYTKEIRKKSINLPYLIFIFQLSIITIPLIIVTLFIQPITHVPTIIAIKLIAVAFSLFSLAAVTSHLIARKVFTLILIKTFAGEAAEGMRIGIRNKIFLQLIPMFIVAILFTSTLGYSRLINEKGDMVYHICKMMLNERTENITHFNNTATVFKAMEGMSIKDTKITSFLVYPDGRIHASDNTEPSAFFRYYIKHPVDNDRIYGDNNEIQGVITKIKINNEDYILGYKFELASDTTVNYILVSFFALLILNVIVLYFFSRTFSNDISMVASSLMEIAEGEEVDLDKKIPVTSNDEIGDLVVAFNKILDVQKAHLRELEEKHEIMMEQQRLASLGQLMAGIAHNMRTPIMSLSGAIEGLKDLTEEYQVSIKDPEVTEEDHEEIAKEMLVWIEKMKPYCAYMSDIITAIRGQTLQSSNDLQMSFTLDDLSKRVQILMAHELVKHHCNFKIDFRGDMNTKINGELGAMVQILNNLVQNAIEAYEGNGGEIELNVMEDKKAVILVVKDYAKGIPADVRQHIFKEMITTKGKSGTGLGLYMSYSNLKARFGGKMWFETIPNVGTSFYISVPSKKE